MATADPQQVRVVADLTLNVTRNANGTLADGAAGLVERVDEVDEVEDVDVTGLTPRLNDLQVDATVTCTVTCSDADPDPATAAARVLEAGFGVAAVCDLRAETIAAPPERLVVEYG